jgi:hypothetical protein
MASLALLVAVLAEAGCSFLGEPSYPSTSVIEPLPRGGSIVLNVTFPPGGSDNDGTRVILIAIPHGDDVGTGISQMTHLLRSRGWTKSMCAPKGGPCAIVGLSIADLKKDYDWPPAPKSLSRLEPKARESQQPTFIVWLGDT